MFCKKGLFIVFFFISNLVLQAQQSLNVRAGFDVTGLGFGYHFAQGGSVLKQGGVGYYEDIAVEAGFAFTEYDLGVHDVQYLNRNGNSPSNYKANAKPGQPGYLGAFRDYLGPQFSIYQHIPIGQGFYVYFTEGARLNYITRSLPYVNSYSSGTETETLITQFKPFFVSGYVETGINYYSEYNVNLYFGLKYVYADAMMQGNYTDIATNGTVINTDHVSASGSYLAFTFNIGGCFWQKQKPVKHKKVHFSNNTYPQGKSLPKTTPPVVNNNTFVPPAERNIKVANTLQVHAKQISIEVWDHETVDGDVLSLDLNGTSILNSYSLTQNKKVVTVTLNPGQNSLVMTAVNQGKYKPCTAAILIDDGKTKQTYILDADFATSGSLVIDYIP